jgi:hypothetical protein
MPQKLTPHTAEWLDAFQMLNPVQAELTKRFIKRAGHSYVCTTCGDTPMGDYLVQMIPYITLRLCQPCLDIYARTYGASLAHVNGDRHANGDARPQAHQDNAAGTAE